MPKKRTPRISTAAASRFHTARTQDRSLRSHVVGALPIVNRLLERMRLEEFLLAYLPVDRSGVKLTTPQGLLLLLRNILLSREPLYGLGEWACGHATDFLGLKRGELGALNDDRVGRCLDRLFDADHSSMILALMTHIIQEFEVELSELHNDSTTIRFFGKYENAPVGGSMRGKPTMGITFGHSKDHRPDLKQLLFILTISRDGAVPVYFTAADGNVTDDRTHRQTWDLLCQLSGRRDFLYVADSKLATAENMAHVNQNGGRFISVLPRTRVEDKQFRERVRAGAVRWKDLYTKTDDDGEILDVFQISEAPLITTEGYRLIWFHSLVKEELDRLARSRRIEAALTELGELDARLRSPRSRFSRREKVTSAVERILEERETRQWIEVGIEQVDEESYRQENRGRPGKGTRYVRNVRSRFGLQYEVNTQAVSAEERTDGIFPLVTNARDLEERQILLAYKKQPLVEKRFSQIKTDFEVAPVYLKNVGRIEALLCVYFLVLLVEALLEREIRNGMSRHRITSLPLYPERRPCQQPCTRRIVDLFENIQRHELTERGHDPTVLVTELSPIQRTVLGLLGIPITPYGHSSRG